MKVEKSALINFYDIMLKAENLFREAGSSGHHYIDIPDMIRSFAESVFKGKSEEPKFKPNGTYRHYEKDVIDELNAIPRSNPSDNAAIISILMADCYNKLVYIYEVFSTDCIIIVDMTWISAYDLNLKVLIDEYNAPVPSRAQSHWSHIPTN